MSLKTWLEEFYPAPASTVVSALEAIDHTLRKWEGALPENLARHGLCKRGFGRAFIREIDGSDDFYFSSTTCGLCRIFAYRSVNQCGTCPILVISGWKCASPTSAFQTWVATGDPGPMLEILRAAKAAHEKESGSAGATKRGEDDD